MARERKARRRGNDVRAAARLAVDATQRVTGVVEEMHGAIAPAPVRLFSGLVYGGVRVVTRMVGAGIDVALAQLEPHIGESMPRPELEAFLAALNGVIGDYLAATGNPFAIEMNVRHEAELGERVMVMVHGSSMGPGQWRRAGHDHGAALAAELGFSPVYVQYNSGLHVSQNGAELAAKLEELVSGMERPPRETVIVAHSMGGLVTRSACHVAERAGHEWRKRLTRFVCLGTPHHGAPLERGGNLFEQLLLVSRYSAPLATLAKLRSAGVTDLRYGNVLDEHWHGRDRFARNADDRTPLPLPAGVACYAVAGTLSRAGASRLASDGLVPVASALGQHRRADLTLAFPDENTWIAHGTGHLELLGSAAVYERLMTWLGA